jgi:hypothetical protein
MSEARAPFVFVGCHELRENLGWRAYDARELLDGLEQVPVGAVFHHVYGYFLRHRFYAGPYANDFASWAAVQLRDRVLGERLAVLDPFEFADLDLLREELVSIVDDHLTHLPMVPRLVYGEPFYFVQSHIVEIATDHRARTLAEFRQHLGEIDASTVYYHMVEARVRLGRRAGDFAEWLRASLGRPDLAEQVERIDLYFLSLERVRARILGLLDVALDEEAATPR